MFQKYASPHLNRLLLVCVLLVATWVSGSLQAQCPVIPTIPAPSCTQSSNGSNLNINQSSDVVCVNGSGNMGTVNFNQAGTLIIEAGQTVSGGINANNGGTLIVRGTFDWNGSANLGGIFEIYVDAGGTLNRAGDLTFNSGNHVFVNEGTVNITNNLTYVGSFYNNGPLVANGFNMNTSPATLVNGANGSIDVAQFLNVNSAAVLDNCGEIEVGINLEINSGSTVRNYCTMIVEGFTQQLATFENYGVFISGLTGGGDGFLTQGVSTTLGDGSILITKDFFWSTNGPIEVIGTARIIVAQSALNASNQLDSLFGPARLRISQGAQLIGTGTLEICDIDPISTGDNPTAPNVTFPAGVAGLVNVASTATLSLSSCDPTQLPALPPCGSTPPEPCQFVDFNTDSLGNPFPAGTHITNQFAAQGVTISAVGGIDEAWIFDSSNPTGNDEDLGTPNQAFGGPGIGIGGGPGSGAVNDTALGNLLIIQENNNTIPDDNRRGGDIIFDFASPFYVQCMRVVDIEGLQGYIRATRSNGPAITLPFPQTGDNGVGVLGIDIDSVTQLTVHFQGSGAIADISFCDQVLACSAATPFPDFTSNSANDNFILTGPNPVLNAMYVQIQCANCSSLLQTVELIDLTGRKMMSQEVVLKDGVGTTVLDVTDLKDGMYFLSVPEMGRQVVRRVTKSTKE